YRRHCGCSRSCSSGWSRWRSSSPPSSGSPGAGPRRRSSSSTAPRSTRSCSRRSPTPRAAPARAGSAEPMELLAIYAGALLVLLAFGIHVATTLFLLGLIGAFFYLGPTMVLTVGTLAWSPLNDFILVAIPLFILLGEILL